MSNYCACRDYGPCIRQTVGEADPFTHAKWGFSPPLDFHSVTCRWKNQLNVQGTSGFQKKLICISPVFVSPTSWFIAHSNEHQAARCFRGPTTAGACHDHSDKARVQRLRTEAPLCIPGNTTLKKNSQHGANFTDPRCLQIVFYFSEQTKHEQRSAQSVNVNVREM